MNNFFKIHSAYKVIVFRLIFYPSQEKRKALYLPELNKMKTTVKQITRLFEINPNSLVKRESAKFWINILISLTEHPLEILTNELEQIKYEEEKQGKESKSVFYYIEAVRRNLELKKHEELKKQVVAPNVKEALKKLFN